ncbi:hypothetical protein GCM10007916_36280 [Psychromonas marina]|uniref:HTH araC/xylS-type domain-containing protein n=1 Tax=Psychromonas marina TaxID=88364 RepID=A0ABQ6E5D9_9GAMM|nr:helix-turn-helix domain-containing protein [Psychromonas marina]GLS92556.1 hypothetical protein GCM10007916_36280 [Psychromonas marina]
MPRKYALGRASIVLPFLDMMEQHGKDPKKITSQLGLGNQTFDDLLLGNPQLHLPSYSLGHILDSSARMTESDDIGFISGSSDKKMMDIHPELIALINNKQSLLGCLVSVVQLQHLQGSHFQCELAYVNSELRIYHTSALLPSHRGFQHSHLFTTARILKFMKQYNGAQWKPDYIALKPNIADTALLAKNTRLGKVLCGLDKSYIPISYNLNDAQLSINNGSFASSTKALQQIKIVINALWELKGFNLDLLAHLFGLSERTIQRLFSDDGSSFRDYLNSVKIKKAKQLLLQGDSVNSIAMQLHYTEAANLTRAMKKQTGLTPIQYVERCK